MDNYLDCCLSGQDSEYYFRIGYFFQVCIVAAPYVVSSQNGESQSQTLANKLEEIIK